PGTGPLFSPFTSPPTSPKSPSSNYNPYFSTVPGDGPNGRRFSFGSETDGDACDNCNLILPKYRTEGISRGSPESPNEDDKRQSNSPVLRTIKPVVAYGTGPGSDEDDEDIVSPTSSDPPSSVLGTSPTPSHESTTA